MAYNINHRFKEEVIIPFVGLNDNVQFLCDKGEKQIICTDGTLCKLKQCEEKKIFDLESDVQRIYGIDTWSFLKRWHSVAPKMDSLSFFKMKLEKL